MLLAKKLHRHAPQEGPSLSSRMGPLASPGARGRRQKQKWDKKKMWSQRKSPARENNQGAIYGIFYTILVPTPKRAFVTPKLCTGISTCALECSTRHQHVYERPLKKSVRELP